MNVVLREGERRLYKTWTASAEDGETVARALEAHLNEFADRVISVCYAVEQGHHVLVVYAQIETSDVAEEAAVAVAEQILDAGPP